MELKGKEILNTGQMLKFLGLNDDRGVLEDFEFEVEIFGELVPESDKLVSLKEGINFGTGKHTAHARGLILYSSDLNGYKYSVEYNRYVHMEFDIKIDELVDFEGNSKEVVLPANIDFPLSFNNYDLDAETYKLTQAGYDAVLTDFVENVEPSRNHDSVKWFARITTTRIVKGNKTELTDEEAMLVAKHAFRELLGTYDNKVNKRIQLPNRKRGSVNLFIGLCDDAFPSFDFSRDGSQVKMRAELSDGKHTWNSKSVIFADAKDMTFSVELTVSGAIEAEGKLARSDGYELEARNSYGVEALVKYDVEKETKTQKVFFDVKGDSYLIQIQIGE